MAEWISIHEQLPERSSINPANSRRLLWCDAENDLPDYAQHTGTFWYETAKTPGMFDAGGVCAFVTNHHGGKRDLYWKYLDPMPKAVKR